MSRRSPPMAINSHRSGRGGIPPSEPGLSLQLPTELLLPVVRQVVEQTLRVLGESRAAQRESRLAYSEDEAAQLLGLESHVLRDERRRGRIKASSIVGRRIRYLRSDLVDYLMARRVEVK